MATLEMPHHQVIDLECSPRRSASDASGVCDCYSYADEGSCTSHEFYFTADCVTNDDCSFASEISVDEGFDSSEVSEDVDLENGVEEKRHRLKQCSNVDRDCRICHLSLVSSSPEDGGGVAIELGCSCKDDLGAAHKHCAETWFKIKGNKTCEICNSIVRNIVGPNDIEALTFQQVHEVNAIEYDNISNSSSSNNNNNNTTLLGAETRSCLNGHRFVNFLLACMVFAFVISWLFHFNIPSS